MKELIINLDKPKDIYKKIYIYKFLSIFKTNFKIKYQNKIYNKYLENYPKEIHEQLHIIDILNMHDKKKKVTYIYDITCDELDKRFSSCNLCGFLNNMCESNRQKVKEKQVSSCCVSGKTKEVCKLFDDNKKFCSVKCITCKIFICPYLYKKKNVRIKFLKIPYIKYFYSPYKKYVCLTSPFTSENEVIKKLLKFI